MSSSPIFYTPASPPPSATLSDNEGIFGSDPTITSSADVTSDRSNGVNSMKYYEINSSESKLSASIDDLTLTVNTATTNNINRPLAFPITMASSFHDFPINFQLESSNAPSFNQFPKSPTSPNRSTSQSINRRLSKIFNNFRQQIRKTRSAFRTNLESDYTRSCSEAIFVSRSSSNQLNLPLSLSAIECTRLQNLDPDENHLPTCLVCIKLAVL